MAFDRIKNMEFPDSFKEEEKELMYALKFDLGLTPLRDEEKIRVMIEIIKELKKDE